MRTIADDPTARWNGFGDTQTTRSHAHDAGVVAVTDGPAE